MVQLLVALMQLQLSLCIISETELARARYHSVQLHVRGFADLRARQGRRFNFSLFQNRLSVAFSRTAESGGVQRRMGRHNVCLFFRKNVTWP